MNPETYVADPVTETDVELAATVVSQSIAHAETAEERAQKIEKVNQELEDNGLVLVDIAAEHAADERRGVVTGRTREQVVQAASRSFRRKLGNRAIRPIW